MSSGNLTAQELALVRQSLNDALGMLRFIKYNLSQQPGIREQDEGKNAPVNVPTNPAESEENDTDDSDADDSGTDDSDTRSVFSDVSNASTVLTIPDVQGPINALPQFTNNQFFALVAAMGRLIRYISFRVTKPKFLKIFTTLPLELDDAFISLAADLTLQACPLTDVLHRYIKKKRCARCMVQLCSDCQQCILCDANDQVFFLRPNQTTNWQRKDSIAVRRVMTFCPEHDMQTHLHHYDCRKQCQCLHNFLPPGNHQCDEAGFIMCKPCVKFTIAMLQEENTRPMTSVEKAIYAPGGNAPFETPRMYVCSCGQDAYPGKYPRCSICHGVCKPFQLNDFHDSQQFSQGAWDRGNCNWYLRPVPDTE